MSEKKVVIPKTRAQLEAEGYTFNRVEKCRACPTMIDFWNTPAGKVAPYDPMPTLESPAISHFGTCTDPARFRKRK